MAQFRKDLETKDHRRPRGIIPSDVKEDAERRDFTMNALFMDPKTFDVIDFVDGEKDIQKRTRALLINFNLDINIYLKMNVRTQMKYKAK